MEKTYMITIFEANTELKNKQKPNFYIELIKIRTNEHKKRKKETSLFQHERRTL